MYDSPVGWRGQIPVRVPPYRADLNKSFGSTPAKKMLHSQNRPRNQIVRGIIWHNENKKNGHRLVKSVKNARRILAKGKTMNDANDRFRIYLDNSNDG